MHEPKNQGAVGIDVAVTAEPPVLCLETSSPHREYYN